MTPLDTLRQVENDEPVPPTRLQRSIPRDLETICLKCLEKEPHSRYASAARLADDLRRFLAGEPIEARPTPFWERGYKWARRRPARAGLFAVSAAAVLLGVGGWWSYAKLSTLANDLFLQVRRADRNAHAVTGVRHSKLQSSPPNRFGYVLDFVAARIEVWSA